MKKRVFMFLFSIILVILGVWADGISKCSLQMEEKKSKTNEKTEIEWLAPDTEYLDYYGLGDFSTDLPVLYIDTQGQQIEKENKKWCYIGIANNTEKEMRSILEEPEELEVATIKMRGASSYSGFDKKQYRIKFYKEYGGNKAKNVDLAGLEEHSEWVLNGPYLDKTLLRNRLCYELAGAIFQWAPKASFCELFLNGEYQGVYVVIEPVTKGETRIDLEDFGLLSGETPYIVKRDRVGTEGEPLQTYGKIKGKTVNDLYIEYPSEKKLTDAQRQWITEDISRFEDCLYSDNFADPQRGYVAYIDVENFADYFIYNEVTMNRDAGNLSTYIYKDLSDRMKLAVWDYNNCYDNYQWYKTEVSRWNTNDNTWFQRLVQDRNFVDLIMKRYKDLREDILTEDYIYGLIDSYQKELGDAVDRNFSIWGYTFEIDLLNPDERGEIRSYNAAIAQLEDTIKARFAYLDEHMADLYDNCIN